MAEQYKYNIHFKNTNFEFLKTLSPTFYNYGSSRGSLNSKLNPSDLFILPI